VVADGHLDAVTQYELWKAIWSSLNDGNFYELDAALARHAGHLEHFTPYTFVGNHDVTRIASRLRDERHLAHALVVLLTTGGTPAVYAGDEHAFRGIKEDRAGGDDAVRPAFPAGPGELSELGLPTYRLHQELIGLRRRHRWLHTARTMTLHLANEQLVYETAADGRRLVVALSVADRPGELPAARAGRCWPGRPTSSAPARTAPASGCPRTGGRSWPAEEGAGGAVSPQPVASPRRPRRAPTAPGTGPRRRPGPGRR
jgi:cyclomaltodextrinase